MTLFGEEENEDEEEKENEEEKEKEDEEQKEDEEVEEEEKRWYRVKEKSLDISEVIWKYRRGT